MTPITLVTGAPGSGKSTIARALASRFERCLVIDVDQLREMMRSGLATPEHEIGGELTAQFRRARASAIHMARINAAEGVQVIIDDVCVPEVFAEHYADLLGVPGARLVLLMPERQVQKERIARRQGPWDHVLVDKIDWLYDYLEPMPKDAWHVIDSGGLSIEETVEAVLAVIQKD